MTRGGMAATAYHEAGHAVAANVLHLKIYKLSILPDVTAGTAGHIVNQSPLHGVRLDYDGSDRARLRAERAIIVSLAGPAAQRRHAPRSWRSYHGQSDFENAADIAMLINGSRESTDAHLKWLEIRARELVELHWREVETVAAALLLEKEMTQDRVADVLLAPRRAVMWKSTGVESVPPNGSGAGVRLKKRPNGS